MRTLWTYKAYAPDLDYESIGSSWSWVMDKTHDGSLGVISTAHDLARDTGREIMAFCKSDHVEQKFFHFQIDWLENTVESVRSPQLLDEWLRYLEEYQNFEEALSEIAYDWDQLTPVEMDIINMTNPPYVFDNHNWKQDGF